jgi:16S rRNA (guanine(966)-N(2))-methyltransferase RsmD
MRVIGGKAKGRRLRLLAGRKLRPTQARVRESLFDILAPRLKGCRFLDLFAGSGAVGVEALSRGAAEAVFVEEAAPACRLINENLRAAGLVAQARVMRQSALAALRRLRREGVEFDLVFLDPPYRSPGQLASALRELRGARPLLRPGGRLVAQMRTKEPSPGGGLGWRLVDERRFGETVLRFYQEEGGGEN